MWQTDGGAKQCTRRGGPSLTEELQTECECWRSVAYIYIFLHKDEKKKSYEEEDCYPSLDLKLCSFHSCSCSSCCVPASAGFHFSSGSSSWCISTVLPGPSSSSMPSQRSHPSLVFHPFRISSLWILFTSSCFWLFFYSFCFFFLRGLAQGSSKECGRFSSQDC